MGRKLYGRGWGVKPGLDIHDCMREITKKVVVLGARDEIPHHWKTGFGQWRVWYDGAPLDTFGQRQVETRETVTYSSDGIEVDLGINSDSTFDEKQVTFDRFVVLEKRIDQCDLVMSGSGGDVCKTRDQVASCRTFSELPLGMCIGEHAGKVLLIVLSGIRSIVSDASFSLAQHVCLKTQASHVLVSVIRMMGVKSASSTFGLYSSLSWRLFLEGADEESGSGFVRLWLVKRKLAGALGERAYGGGVIGRVLPLPLHGCSGKFMYLMCVDAGVTVRGGRGLVGHFDSYVEKTSFWVY